MLIVNDLRKCRYENKTGTKMSNVDLQITAENTPYLTGMPEPVLRIRISGIHMFLDLPDPHPDL
jgi:hypothetical protein